MKFISRSLILRFTLATVLLSHSLHGLFTKGDINGLGTMFLDPIGFAPFGVTIAWMIIILQIVTAFCFLVNKFVTIAAVINILILLGGIVLVHFKEGWFVVGAGRNGMEFSVVLIMMLIAITIPEERKRIKY